MNIFTDTEGNFKISYDISKSRVAPIKQTRTPKFGLEAAPIGAELAVFVVAEMSLSFSSIYFWTNSSATVGWIK